MNNAACQCGAWPETCGAFHVGTRGLCAACITGKCERPRPAVPPGALMPHRAPGTTTRYLPKRDEQAVANVLLASRF